MNRTLGYSRRELKSLVYILALDTWCRVSNAPSLSSSDVKEERRSQWLIFTGRSASRFLLCFGSDWLSDSRAFNAYKVTI